jgi:phosphoribosylanthranilate isomerase
MTTHVKICGLMTLEAVYAAVEAGADRVGFVFFGPSPRNLDTSVAAELMTHVPPHVTKVALTVDADEALLEDIVTNTSVDLLQLHGSETSRHVADLKVRFGLPVMKMISVSEAADLAAVAPYEGIADKLLFDAKPPKDATRPGGNALAFDWKILRGFDAPMPWMLAGGLDAENVAEAVRVSGAPEVDVSSGVEDAPGLKNGDKIRAFIRAAKAD